MKGLVALLVAILAAAGSAMDCRAQEPSPCPAPSVQGRRIFVGISVSEYPKDPKTDRATWPPLPNTKRDVQDFGKLLQEQFDFIVPDTMQLHDAQATKSAIEGLVEETLHRCLRGNDDLVLMYSGHGTRRADTIGEPAPEAKPLTRGFLVPYGARSETTENHWSDYVDLVYLLEAVATLPAKHVLVILDSCDAGAAITGTFAQKMGGASTEEKELSERLGRKILAASEDDQAAEGSSRKYPGYSLFTGYLLDVLQNARADRNYRGFVDSEHLFVTVSDEVKASEDGQIPVKGAFTGDAGGDIVFRYPVEIGKLKDDAYRMLQQGQWAQFKSIAQRLNEANRVSAPALWCTYRRAISEGDLTQAQDAVRQLSAISNAGALTPIPLTTFRKVSRDLESHRFLRYPPKPVPFRVEVRVSGLNGFQPIPGEREVDGVRYEMPVDTAFRFSVQSTSQHSFHLDCVSIDPDGLIDAVTGCGTDIQPAARIEIPSQTGIDAVVVEYHFYASACSIQALSAADGNSPDGCQSMIRISFTNKPKSSNTVN